MPSRSYVRARDSQADLTSGQLGRLLGVSAQTVARKPEAWPRCYRLPNGDRRFRRQDVEAWLRARQPEYDTVLREFLGFNGKEAPMD